MKFRAFLKWAGGKYTLMDELNARLPDGERLVEPFVGSGTVFLNSRFQSFLLSDINSDLINLYNHVKTNPEQLISLAKSLFTRDNNTEVSYYGLRNVFNESVDTLERSALFIYLNRHGYNGLCRYNLSGGFNVPFGSYKAPYFPENEIYLFSEKAQNATFRCQPFTDTFAQTLSKDVVYCDPPYAPLSDSANFSSYAKDPFGVTQQLILSKLAESCCRMGTNVLISNHDTKFTRDLYKRADQICYLNVARSISCKSARSEAPELIACYRAR